MIAPLLTQTRFTSLALAAVAVTALGGCNMFTRLSQVGEEPPLTTIQNPTLQENYRPVNMPMPEPRPAYRNPNSLWPTGARAFFKDQRASEIGDILTVVIDLNDSAELSNETERSRTANEDASLNAFLGYESSASRILPEAIDPGDLIDADSTSLTEGAGSISREEEIELNVAAVVTQVLPNGNMVVLSRQEVRVNFELRELQIAGVIRPEDISSTNTVPFEKIAEVRLAYGGRGHITDVQQPRYGQQIYDIIFPW